jgi:hypothetical protein
VQKQQYLPGSDWPACMPLCEIASFRSSGVLKTLLKMKKIRGFAYPMPAAVRMGPGRVHGKIFISQVNRSATRLDTKA